MVRPVRSSGYCSQDDLQEWLDRLAKTTTLIAPREVDGLVLYRAVAGSQDIAWGFDLPVLSPKEYFFPATERLLLIEKTGQQVQLTETLPEDSQVIFGMRPCDARGIRVLDALFLESHPVDPYYARRRENTAIIGLACREMGESCFCTSLGGAPDDPQHVDVMITAVEDHYWVEAITPQGYALAEDLLEDGAGKINESLEPSSPGHHLVPAVPVPQAQDWPALFNHPYWECVAERCLSCRICAYVCPTCRCFDLRDEPVQLSHSQELYERIRCWDSCTGENYRRIAGGHNPRQEKVDRLRNRFFCKFFYYFKQYGSVACTGCGRCREACPVNIDVMEILEHLAG